MLSANIAIALNRFGLGARPADPPPPDAAKWLHDQLDAYDPNAAIRAAVPPDPPDTSAGEKQRLRRLQYQNTANARIENALSTNTPFPERLVHFWSNHFAVSADKGNVQALAGPFEAEAIRPHILGRFEDLLLAVERHPAMLVYLDQPASIGPNSRRASHNQDGKKTRGLNENLAREIMELHTLGVRSGYTQLDVTEFARALTGWSLDHEYKFVFHPPAHEPGERSIMGRVYKQDGEDQARGVLHDLASAKPTAVHIATKLARHFAGDTPPPTLIDSLSKSFNKSHGDLRAVYRTLIDSPDCWHAEPVKFKTPWEWTISALRGIGEINVPMPRILATLGQLGQPIWKPGSPAGWDDTAATWAAPDALMRRLETASKLVTAVPADCDPLMLAEKLLASPLSSSTQAVIRGADTRLTGLALLFVSPEFQRR